MSGPDPMFRRDMGMYVEEPPVTRREVIIGGICTFFLGLVVAGLCLLMFRVFAG